jgi:predicted MFS family arabinose efflux permease
MSATPAVLAAPAARPALPPTAAFVGAALSFAALYLAAGAPSTLLVSLEESWHFAPGLLTIAFAAYAISLLGALLVTGSLSDHIGRRPVIVGALALETVAMLVFVFSNDIAWVIAARLIQGFATGAASSAFTAWVVEIAPARFRRLGGIVAGTAPAGGLGLGALLSGVAVQFTTDATAVVFTILAVVMAAGALVAMFSTETVSRRPGALATLVPRVTIPTPARREFTTAIPAHVASWMLAGLFLGLVPSIIRTLFHIDSGLLNGVTAFIEPGAAAAIGFVLGGVAARRVTILGGVAVLVGTVIIVAGIAFGLLPLIWVGALFGGVGFGGSFSGSLRVLAPLAQPHERAALFAGVYLVAYLAFGVPVIIAGQLIAPLGLLTVSLGYGFAIVILAAVGVALQVRQSRRALIQQPR